MIYIFILKKLISSLRFRNINKEAKICLLSIAIGPMPTDKLAALTLHAVSFYFNFFLIKSVYI